MAPKPIRLDGSMLEGGGQLVRVAVALSAITSIPVTIFNIRANRSSDRRSRKSTNSVQGGLKESHLAAILYLGAQCDADIDGVEVGSREVTFVPGAGFRAPKGDLVDMANKSITLKGPGSVWLVLQAILPWCMLSAENIELTIHGGTNVPKSMSGEYVEHVLLPMLRKLGITGVETEVVERGWAGGAPHIGQVRLKCVGTKEYSIPAFEAEDRQALKRVLVKIVAPTDFSEMLSDSLAKVIALRLGKEIDIEFLPSEDSKHARRVYVLLIAETCQGWRLGRDCLGSGRMPRHEGDKRKIVHEISESVVRDLYGEIRKGGCVDEFMQDQLVIFQTLAAGRSHVDGGTARETVAEVESGDSYGSLHTKTVRWVCEQMLAKQGLRFESNGYCEGVRWNQTSKPI